MTDPGTRAGRLFTEGAVIIVSILIAFGIDAWWDGRQDRTAYRDATAALVEEIDRNLQMLESQEAFVDSILGEVVGLVEISSGSRSMPPTEELEARVSALFALGELDIGLGTVAAVRSSELWTRLPIRARFYFSSLDLLDRSDEAESPLRDDTRRDILGVLERYGGLTNSRAARAYLDPSLSDPPGTTDWAGFVRDDAVAQDLLIYAISVRNQKALIEARRILLTDIRRCLVDGCEEDADPSESG